MNVYSSYQTISYNTAPYRLNCCIEQVIAVVHIDHFAVLRLKI